MRRLMTLVLLTGLVALSLEPAYSQQSAKSESLVQRLARKTKLKEEQIEKLLEELGPAVQEDLARGKVVNLQGLGQWRVVRISQHKDMAQGGRPITVPAYNSIEFQPASQLKSVANAPGAVPQETVPAFEYQPLQNQTPGQKVGRTRTPANRTK